MPASKLPIVASIDDFPNNVLGYASTQIKAKKLILQALSDVSADDVVLEKIGLDNLLNTSGVEFWQYRIRQRTKIVNFGFDDAIELLGLTIPFDLMDLKTAYRAASKRTHPDLGGSQAEFIQVDRAYDLLRSRVEAMSGDRWDTYRAANLSKWEAEFRDGWKHVCDQGLKFPGYQHQGAYRYGLHYSTYIEKFTRSFTEPLKEWFLHCVYAVDFLPTSEGAPSHTEIRNAYRAHLIAIAPNKLMAEVWARKYYQLEFGENTPWIFYLMPAREVEARAP